MSKRPFRKAATIVLKTLESASNIEIIPVTEQLYTQAVQLYTDRPDKEWGLTDCISFVVMREMKISEALTADRHFKQAGFKALMR